MLNPAEQTDIDRLVDLLERKEFLCLKNAGMPGIYKPFWNRSSTMLFPKEKLVKETMSEQPFTRRDEVKGDDLKVYLDKEVACVDFCIDKGEPGLTLELNCGESVWTPVCVKKLKGVDSCETHDSALTMDELSAMDDIVFEIDDSPGVVLKKGCLEVWTPIASRTRSNTNLDSLFTVNYLLIFPFSDLAFPVCR